MTLEDEKRIEFIFQLWKRSRKKTVIIYFKRCRASFRLLLLPIDKFEI